MYSGQELDFSMFDAAGIVGAIIVVIAYVRISTGDWNDTVKIYHLMNIFGASLILISLFSAFNYATLLLQIVWISVAIAGVLKNRDDK